MAQEISQPRKLGEDMLVLGAREVLWKKELEEGIEKLSGSRETGLDRLLDLDTGVVVLKAKSEFHWKP